MHLRIPAISQKPCEAILDFLLPLRVRIFVIQKLKASFHFFITLIHRRHGGRNEH
ncbi:hypothetical protein IKE07_02730 [Candidatus Saccharibacteria bacterium]|nr:hypothetical protein [Candidatus Saccharibacteria bacterium]